MTEMDVAALAVRAAGEVLRRLGPPGQIRQKGAVDLVTEVDVACERAIRDTLARLTPTIPVVGEEEGGDPAPTRWIVDPIDGTTNFIHGFPVFGVSVGLYLDDAPFAGAILDGAHHDVYRAQRGLGAFMDATRLRVSDRSDLGACLVGTGFPYDRREPGKAAFYLRRVQSVLERVRCVRRAGAASMDLVFVASGRLDAFFEYHLAPWDVAAGLLLVEEAGGRVTSLDGGPLDARRPCPLATNGRVHDALRELLASVQD
jgi:myo-inositol-1(or 4)-monophosphatase